ncbi:DUF4394 domain-containing protein [Streptomyces erythrochromogenes]|uniref:DUF4394 domain-containing protein n=1 Tax=Streptomyces erythrochromogenes TaxID=285574 RepID=UPI00224D20F0|nr:DUF4394 domain-containing protein [Streptomyces erythrochromogenes]MCX5581938.1 DUF4394 domain-containing protein [Streptomyces erythrochromogenes]
MRKTVLVMALAAALSVTGPAVAADSDQHDHGRGGLKVTGLTDDQRLVSFRADDPDRVSTAGTVTGLAGDTTLVGIDYRVQDGLLYGVGNAGGVYTLDTANAAATKVSQLSIALTGTAFGVDFNPAADRLRIISDTGQNLRHNVNVATGGTVADGTLTTPPATTPALGVTGAAYTNNDLDAATATSLFDIDTAGDRVVLQSPANSGALAPTGSLGVDAGPSAGFDIYFSPRDGSNQGFAALSTGGSYRFYKVNPLTGAARDAGAFPNDRQVFDVALPLAQK